MANFRVDKDDGSGFYRIQESEDCEFVNPVEYFANQRTSMTMALEFDMLHAKEPEMAKKLWPKFFEKRGFEYWQETYDSLKAKIIPSAFSEILSLTKKKDQLRFLKNQSIEADHWIAFIIYAWEKAGYTYSKYSCEIGPSDLKDGSLPKLAHLDGENIKKVGETNLSDGQIKNAINHRKVIVSHFLDREENWHCFFITQRSMKGEESWKGGQSHFHYISSAFGVPRNEVVERIKSGNYPSTNVHVDLIGFGNQAI